MAFSNFNEPQRYVDQYALTTPMSVNDLRQAGLPQLFRHFYDSASNDDDALNRLELIRWHVGFLRKVYKDLFEHLNFPEDVHDPNTVENTIPWDKLNVKVSLRSVSNLTEEMVGYAQPDVGASITAEYPLFPMEKNARLAVELIKSVNNIIAPAIDISWYLGEAGIDYVPDLTPGPNREMSKNEVQQIENLNISRTKAFAVSIDDDKEYFHILEYYPVNVLLYIYSDMRPEHDPERMYDAQSEFALQNVLKSRNGPVSDTWPKEEKKLMFPFLTNKLLIKARVLELNAKLGCGVDISEYME